jgi:GTP cyclohydrolase FolE2
LNARDSFTLPDTQALPDLRRLSIQKVGVKDLRYPVTLRDGDGATQRTIARSSMQVGLAHNPRSHITVRVELPAGDMALQPKDDPRVGRFSVASENLESIHNLSAYAEIAGRGAARVA